jgi:transposase InsO family protein
VTPVETAEDGSFDSVSVLSGIIYKIRIELLSEIECSQRSVMDVGLDTCGGCNLIRKDALPPGSTIYPLLNPPNVHAAQGKQLEILGVASLVVMAGEGIFQESVQFLVVPNLVVPALLGTPWINSHVLRIEPRTKEIVLQTISGDPVTISLVESSGNSVVRIAQAVTVPSFSETFVAVRTNRSGLSMIRPAYRCSHDYAHAKNGIIELPPVGETFYCLVSNFSDTPLTLRKNQVVGIAEGQTLTFCTPSTSKEDEGRPEWENTLKQKLNHLPGEEASKSFEILRPFADIWDGHLGKIEAVQHHILTEGPPVASQPYRVGPTARESISKEVDRMLSMDVIEPCSGPWASPIVLIPKPDGSIRFCVDYRRLNKVTRKDSYALPRMDDCIDSLGTAQFFSTLDANAGYWQISVAPEDRDKTAFTSHRGLYRFKRLPFGLVSAPATFQRAIDVILSSVRFQCAITYLDDIIIYSSSFEQHLRDLGKVLKLLRDSGITLKLSKCSFFVPEVQYLGFVVGRDGLKVDGTKLEAIQKALPPRSKTHIRRFLGMTGVYRRFIAEYAKMASPLTRYLKNEQEEEFQIDEAALKAHESLKEAITTAPVLSLPRPGANMVLEADASNAQLGVQLLQEEDENKFRPVGFWSRQCTKAECNYSATEKEALAVVWGIRICRPYLEGTHFVVRSDHQALRWLFSLAVSDANPRLVRWRLALSSYDFEVQYKPGSKQKVADALSRLPTDGMTVVEAEEGEEYIPTLTVDIHQPPSPSTPRLLPMVKVSEPMTAVTTEEVLRAQEDDSWCTDLKTRLRTSPESLREFFLSEDEMLCYSPLREGLEPRIVVPISLRERLMTLYHFPAISGHVGTQRLIQTIYRAWYWPSLSRDVTEFIKRCPSCAAQRLKRGPQRTHKLTIFPPEGPLEFVAMDVLGPLPETKRGNRFCVVMCDRFTKISIAVPTPNQTAETCAQVFVDRWICYYGVPLIILSDNGSNFASKFFSVLTHILGIKHVFTSPYRPSTNGQTERWNATLVDTITHYLFAEKDWDELVGVATASYNHSVHSSTGFAPFEIALNRVPRGVLAPTSNTDSCVRMPLNKQTYRHNLLARAAKLAEAAKEKNLLQLERYKNVYDHKVKNRHKDLQLGDSVLIRTYMLEPSRSPKFVFPVAGPYVVIRIDGPHVTVRTREGPQKHHLDRVIRAPISDLPPGLELIPNANASSLRPIQRITAENLSSDEYVIDRLISHAQDDDGAWLVRVRWAGFDSSDDTWEPAVNLPPKLIRKYEKQKKVHLL